MTVWQLQEAKAKLTELVKCAKLEPQIISRHGVEETVVMSMKKYRELVKKEQNIAAFFQNSPLKGLDIDITRDKSKMRKVDL